MYILECLHRRNVGLFRKRGVGVRGAGRGVRGAVGGGAGCGVRGAGCGVRGAGFGLRGQQKSNHKINKIIVIMQLNFKLKKKMAKFF